MVDGAGAVGVEVVEEFAPFVQEAPEAAVGWGVGLAGGWERGDVCAGKVVAYVNSLKSMVPERSTSNILDLVSVVCRIGEGSNSHRIIMRTVCVSKVV